MAVVRTNMSPVGTIKKLHGVGQPPFTGVSFHMLII